MPVLYNRKNIYVSIWKWVQKYSELADSRFRTDKRLVKEIFIDETLLQIDGIRIIGCG